MNKILLFSFICLLGCSKTPAPAHPCIDKYGKFKNASDSIGVITRYVTDIPSSTIGGLRTGDYVYVAGSCKLLNGSPFLGMEGKVCRVEWITDGFVKADSVSPRPCMYFLDKVTTAKNNGSAVTYLFFDGQSGQWLCNHVFN